jgi:hypothetical protein
VEGCLPVSLPLRAERNSSPLCPSTSAARAQTGAPCRKMRCTKSIATVPATCALRRATGGTAPCANNCRESQRQERRSGALPVGTATRGAPALAYQLTGAACRGCLVVRWSSLRGSGFRLAWAQPRHQPGAGFCGWRPPMCPRALVAPVAAWRYCLSALLSLGWGGEDWETPALAYNSELCRGRAAGDLTARPLDCLAPCLVRARRGVQQAGARAREDCTFCSTFSTGLIAFSLHKVDKKSYRMRSYNVRRGVARYAVTLSRVSPASLVQVAFPFFYLGSYSLTHKAESFTFLRCLDLLTCSEALKPRRVGGANNVARDTGLGNKRRSHVGARA